jgi:ferredoxin-type protein NapH
MPRRGLIFGIGAASAIVAAVFPFDIFFARNGRCGHVCPVGALNSLPALKSPLRVVAGRRAPCDDCMDCYTVCPAMQVIKPAHKGKGRGTGPAILSPNRTNCGRRIDVCSKDVFRVGLPTNSWAYRQRRWRREAKHPD